MTTVILECPACGEDVTVPLAEVKLHGDRVTIWHCGGWQTRRGLTDRQVQALMLALALHRRYGDDDVPDGPALAVALEVLDRAVTPADLWPGERENPT